MKENLLLLVPSLASGGQEKVVARTSDILANDYNVTIAIFNSKNIKYNVKCNMIDINIPSSKGFLGKIINVIQRCSAIKKVKKENKIDVTISFGTTANIINALTSTMGKNYVSVRGYSSINNTIASRIFWRYIYSKSNGVISVSKKMSADIQRIYSIPKEKLYTLYNPYDCDECLKLAKEEILMELPYPTIVSMGRITSVKGYHHLLKALKIALTNISNLKLILIGEGELKNELLKYSKNLGIERNVSFVNFQSNPYSYIGKCHLYILSSINEGFPNALVESMACGIPVIATDCYTGPREIITERFEDKVAEGIEYSDFGVLIPPFISDDSDESEKDKMLAKAIVGMLNDKERYEYYQKRSLERAKTFSKEKYKEYLINIIKGLK